jgi:hypothetical protein
MRSVLNFLIFIQIKFLKVKVFLGYGYLTPKAIRGKLLGG